MLFVTCSLFFFEQKQNPAPAQRQSQTRAKHAGIVFKPERDNA